MPPQKITVDLSNLRYLTNSIYWPLMANTDRYLIVKGGAGSGKSHFMAQKILMRTLVEKRSRILVVRKVAATLRKSVWQLFQDLSAEYGLGQVLHFRKSEFTIECKGNGNEIWCVGLDDREKIKSITGVTSMWIEEATELSEEDFDQLDLRMRGPGKTYKQIMASFNPISPTHWIKSRFWGENDDNREIVRKKIAVEVPNEGTLELNATLATTGYVHNRFIDGPYKAKLESLKEVNPEYYKVYALGHWGALMTLIYYPTPNVVSKKDWEAIRFASTFYGLDFGFADPTALIQCNTLPSNAMEVFEKEILYRSGMTTSELVEFMLAKFKELHGEDWNRVPIYADSAEPDRIKELKQAGFNVRPANKAKHSIADGILFCKSIRCHVHEDSTNLQHEYGGYCWSTNKEEKLTDVPVDFNNHLMDAKRYAEYTHLWAGGKTSYVGTTSKRVY